MPETYVGLMSGTSLDGIDAALVDFSSGVRVIHAITADFPPALRSTLQEIIQRPDNVTLDLLGHTDAELGNTYGEVVLRLLDEANISRNDVGAIGCHGQTIRHCPDVSPTFTWQLGDPNRIVSATGIPVVADFRRMDMALGGEGAPLVPAFHAAMFGSSDEVRAVVNLGGIANITRLGDAVTGYDIGPGNGLMDAWIREHLGKDFDRDGAWAASGKIDEQLLAEFLADEFFRKPPPRSTGREHFNLDWVKARPLTGEIAPENVQATLLALTADTVAKEVRRAQAHRVLVCGGGARNIRLIAALQEALGDIVVETTDAHGLDAEFVEAAAFAWLARERLAGRPGSLAGVTGARRDAILGALYLP